MKPGDAKAKLSAALKAQIDCADTGRPREKSRKIVPDEMACFRLLSTGNYGREGPIPSSLKLITEARCDRSAVNVRAGTIVSASEERPVAVENPLAEQC